MTRIPGTRTRVYRNDALWDRVRELDELIEAGEALEALAAEATEPTADDSSENLRPTGGSR